MLNSSRGETEIKPLVKASVTNELYRQRLAQAYEQQARTAEDDGAASEARDCWRRAVGQREELLKQFTVLYPTEGLLRDAMRGCAAYQLNWFDAHIWAYAEHYGLPELFTEDLQHDRLFGSVRIVNPFQ